MTFQSIIVRHVLHVHTNVKDASKVLTDIYKKAGQYISQRSFHGKVDLSIKSHSRNNSQHYRKGEKSAVFISHHISEIFTLVSFSGL